MPLAPLRSFSRLGALPLEIDGDAVDGLVSGYTARVLKSAIRVVVDPTSPYYPKDATA